jgi:hypothetical protein
MVKANAPTRPISDPAEAAIARVLQAERDAGASIALAHRQADAIAEAARADARSVAERTERRIRGVVGAFEQHSACRLAVIDAEAVRMTTPHVLAEPELQALDAAVGVLGLRRTGAAP